MDIPYAGEKNAVDAAQLDVDLEAEVGQRLRRGLVDVLGLHALGRQPKHDVPNPLHLRCRHKPPPVSLVTMHRAPAKTTITTKKNVLGWRGWSVEGAVYMNTRGSVLEENLGSKLGGGWGWGWG